MTNIEWLESNAKLVESAEPGIASKSWVTKDGEYYVTLEGMEDKSVIDMLRQFGITEQVQSTWGKGKPINIGFNPIEQKWYGWSHRAVYGFGVGSKCERGDCHYKPKDEDDFLKDTVKFWSDKDKINVAAEHQAMNGKGEPDGVYVSWEYAETTPNKSLHGQISGLFNEYPDTWGRGEWTANNLDDAKQMAIDFAEGVA